MVVGGWSECMIIRRVPLNSSRSADSIGIVIVVFEGILRALSADTCVCRYHTIMLHCTASQSNIRTGDVWRSIETTLNVTDRY